MPGGVGKFAQRRDQQRPGACAQIGDGQRRLAVWKKP